MARLHPRLLGVLLFGGACAASAVHREIYARALHGPAQTLEFILAAITFVLATSGILLMIHGSDVFRNARKSARSLPEADTQGEVSHLRDRTATSGSAFDTRQGAAMMRAHHAISTSRRARCTLAAAICDAEHAARKQR